MNRDSQQGADCTVLLFGKANKKNPVAKRPRDLILNGLFALEADSRPGVKDGAPRAVACGAVRVPFRLAV